MTVPQFNLLQWFAAHGGRGFLEQHIVIMVDKTTTSPQQLVTLLHLVADGCLSGSGGYLSLTEHGRRCVERTETGELPL